MKTKRFFQLGLAVAATAMLAACSNGGDGKTPSSPTGESGSFSEISVSRTEIYKEQPTTFSCTYTPSSDVILDKSVAVARFTNPAGASFESPAKYENGGFSNVGTFMGSGQYKVAFVVNEMHKNQKFVPASKSITVNVSDKDTDIRNSMWYSSKDYCKQDIKAVPISDFKEEANQFSFKERNAYNGTDVSLAGRTVIYKFAEQKLVEVDYDIVPSSSKLEVFPYVVNTTLMLVNEKYGYPTTRDYVVTPGMTLTADEEKAANDYKNCVKPDSQKKTTFLADAIQAGKLTLSAQGGNAVTKVNMESKKNPNGTMPTFILKFTPAK